MRPTFVLNDDYHAVSALRPREAAHAIKPAAAVTFGRAYAAPGGVVPKGSRGTVEYVDEREGTVWIRVAGAPEALKTWDNMVVLSPFETDELAECLVFAPASLTWRRVAIAACVPAAFILGVLLDCPATAAMSALAGLLDYPLP